MRPNGADIESAIRLRAAVLARKVVDPGKLLLACPERSRGIVGDDGIAERNGLSGDYRIALVVRSPGVAHEQVLNIIHGLIALLRPARHMRGGDHHLHAVRDWRAATPIIPALH